MSPTGLLPEIWLLLGALVVLLGGSFLPRRRLGLTRVATLLVLAGAFASAAVQLAGPAFAVFDGTYAVDEATGAARLVTVVATGLIVALSRDELRENPRQAETYTLLLLATLGTVVLAGATDLMIVLTGFLLASVPLYGLVGLPRSSAASEAALKTYLYGSLFGIVLMAGIVVLYGLAGTTGYADLAVGLATAPPGAVTFATVLIIGGLMFKAGGVPGHFWIPDAAQGSSTLAATYLTTVPKVGALVAAYRLADLFLGQVDVLLLVGVFAAASMTLGNLAAYRQSDPARLLGWSTVSQVGYLLVPVAVAGRSPLAEPSLLVYLAGYAVTNVAAFALIAAFPGLRTLDSYRGLGRRHPVLAGVLVVSLLGLVGTPPTVVFVGKLAVATTAWDGGAAWLAVLLFANSVASLFYYLRWLVPAFLPPREPAGPAPQPSGARTAVVSGFLSLALGIFSAGLWALFGLPLVG